MFYLFTKGFRAIVILSFGFFIVIPVNASVDMCVNVLESSREKLETIKMDLELVVTKSQYQKNIENRYDSVERLLHVAASCSSNKNISETLVKEWRRLEDIVSSLHSNAQACTFTKFADWMMSKESDLNAFRQAVSKPDAKSGIKQKSTNS